MTSSVESQSTLAHTAAAHHMYLSFAQMSHMHLHPEENILDRESTMATVTDLKGATYMADQRYLLGTKKSVTITMEKQAAELLFVLESMPVWLVKGNIPSLHAPWARHRPPPKNEHIHPATHYNWATPCRAKTACSTQKLLHFCAKM